MNYYLQLRNLAFGRPTSGQQRSNKKKTAAPSEEEWEKWQETDKHVRTGVGTDRQVYSGRQ